MQPRVFLILFVLALVSTSHAQNIPRTSLSLEATSVNAGNAGYYTWRTDYGSFSRTTHSSKSLGVTLRNMGPKPAAARLEWFFFAGGSHTADKLIFDGGNNDVAFAPRQEQRLGVTSRVIQRQTTAYVALGLTENIGLDTAGWMVSLRSEECPGCGGAKVREAMFCLRCRGALPRGVFLVLATLGREEDEARWWQGACADLRGE